MTKDITIKIVSTDEDYSHAMSVRRSVFVDEYKIPARLEFDGNDHGATHILALCGENPVGTMRIRYFNGFVKFERMCVLSAYRKTDISEKIMRKGMQFVAQKGYQTVYGVCKKELLERWSQDGFEKILGVEPVEQNGMTLVPIHCSLPLPQNRITMQTPLNVLNAKEGDWDWENSAEQNETQKRWKNINHKLRRLTQQIHNIKKPKSEKVEQPIIKKSVSREL